MAMLRLFKSTLPSCKTYLESGKELNFVGGRYATDIEEEISFLETAIKAKHPNFFVDEAEVEIDSVRVDPVEAIRRKAIADYIAEQEAKVGTDTGTTTELKKIVTTEAAIASMKSNIKSQ